jgi:hypothetical protein
MVDTEGNRSEMVELLLGPANDGTQVLPLAMVY